ncbi:MAG: hypothetical protein ACOCUO_01010 [archaeon]
MKQLRAFVTGVFLFAVVLVGVLGIAWAVSAQYDQAPETTTNVTDEDIVADTGNWTGVDAPDYALSFDDETITNSSGTQLDEGSDYDWNSSTGEIHWYNTSAVSDGETMQIDYSYSAKTEQARSVQTILAVPINLILPAGILIVVAMAVAGLAAGSYSLLTSSGGSRTLTRR